MVALPRVYLAPASSAFGQSHMQKSAGRSVQRIQPPEDVAAKKKTPNFGKQRVREMRRGLRCTSSIRLRD
jgi:hypothetical protein